MQDSSECIEKTRLDEFIEISNLCDCSGEFWIIDYDGNPVTLSAEKTKDKVQNENDSMTILA